MKTRTFPIALILLGAPGSGKGTQAKLLQERLGFIHISTGDLLRAHVSFHSLLGQQAKTYMDKGHLVPDVLVLGMLLERITQPDCAAGYILDGFPRTMAQAEALDTFLVDKAVPLVFNLQVADELLIERLVYRISCARCGKPYHLLQAPPQLKGVCDQCQGALKARPDDTELTIRERLRVYHAQTAPLVAFYENRKELYPIDCSGDPLTVMERILKWVPPHCQDLSTKSPT